MGAFWNWNSCILLGLISVYCTMGLCPYLKKNKCLFDQCILEEVLYVGSRYYICMYVDNIQILYSYLWITSVWSNPDRTNYVEFWTNPIYQPFHLPKPKPLFVYQIQTIKHEPSQKPKLLTQEMGSTQH